MSRYGGATACVSIQPDDDVPPIVLDLGTGSRLLGEELVERFFPGQRLSGGAPPPGDLRGPPVPPNGGPPVLEMNAFVSHLHFDHVQGLPFFGPALRHGASLTIHGPAQDDMSLESSVAAFVQPPYFPVGLAELPSSLRWREISDREAITIRGAVVLAREVPHVGRTFGYRVECGGVVVAYLGDHQAPMGDRGDGRGPAIPEAALELADKADLLIHDAQYTDEEFAVKAHWGHSTVEFALAVARSSGAERLALFHHDPTHDDDLLDEMAADASRRAAGEFAVVMAAEGLSIKLG
jgi:phosphoribosyl 1,2-cyclic phosphodiesterase